MDQLVTKEHLDMRIAQVDLNIAKLELNLSKPSNALMLTLLISIIAPVVFHHFGLV